MLYIHSPDSTKIYAYKYGTFRVNKNTQQKRTNTVWTHGTKLSYELISQLKVKLLIKLNYGLPLQTGEAVKYGP